MKTDRTTKVLLALIAMALFLNAIVPLAQPAVVQAQSGTSEIRLSQIFKVAFILKSRWGFQLQTSPDFLLPTGS